MIKTRKKRRGFTLIELMVVVAILGILATTTAIRLDIFGSERNQEIDRLLTFVRTQHARAMRESHTIRIRIDAKKNRLTAKKPDDSTVQTLTFSYWSIGGQSPESIRLTPWFVEGEALHLQSDQESRTFVPDSTLTLREQGTS